MPLKSVDALQTLLADTVFTYAKDRKKAAGRALGTFVELIAFYALRAWDFRNHVVIERPVPEFGNSSLVHNVEFALHPVVEERFVRVERLSLPLTAAKLKKHVSFMSDTSVRTTQILGTDGVKRNACVLTEDTTGLLVANVDAFNDSYCDLTVCRLLPNSFAIFECKRVGVEDGMRKGPQTIEKAKQGAYVARTVSALQKVRLRNSRFQGVLERQDGTFPTRSYH